MTEKLISIYYPYAFALETNMGKGVLGEDKEIIRDWVEKNHVKSVKVVKNDQGKYVVSEGYCPVCEDYATRMLCKVITE